MVHRKCEAVKLATVSFTAAFHWNSSSFVVIVKHFLCLLSYCFSFLSVLVHNKSYVQPWLSCKSTADNWFHLILWTSSFFFKYFLCMFPCPLCFYVLAFELFSCTSTQAHSCLLHLICSEIDRRLEVYNRWTRYLSTAFMWHFSRHIYLHFTS